MRIVQRILVSIMFATMLCMPLFHPAYAATDVETGYSNIMADGLIFANICKPGDRTAAGDTCECRAHGKCSLEDMMQIFVNISIGILGICGSVALLVFFYGGFLWVTAAGNEKKVAHGKDALTKAVIGLAIIFGAYAFVNFIIAGIAGKTPSATIEDTVKDVTTGQGQSSSP